MISAFITNLGEYNEGELCGEWLKFPAQKADVQALFSRIGVDGVMYEEFFITDYETDIDGLCKYMGEYESIDELNYLAALLEDLDEWDLEKFEAAAVYGDDSGSVKALINLTKNLDCYEYFPGVNGNSELGRYLIEDLGWEDSKIPEWIEPYFDYEEYGRDFALNEGGDFLKNGGYVSRNDVDFEEHYTGRDIPDEYCIFAFPEPEKSVAAALDKYKQMIAEAPISAHARQRTVINAEI